MSKKPDDGPTAAAGKGEMREVKLGVRYDEFLARYANQVAIRTTPEEVFLEFSSGVIPDPSGGQSLLPIHTRIAMSPAAARRFSEILTQALARPQITSNEARTDTVAGDRASGFPPLKA